ncbi:MAG: hypothetical protein IPK60_22040 [Sandaracinaceae bacterium]|jgi:hypothetical protein|nr:hypothetical protein [Sandaracinaceae bacterium]
MGKNTWLIGLLLCMSALPACTSPTAAVHVRVVSDLVPGVQFSRVMTTLYADAAGQARPRDASEARARFGLNYANGHDVATFALELGTYRVRASLLQGDGRVVVERDVLVNVAGDTVVTMHLTRECVDVVCPAPGGSAELSTCVAGRCVDPRCSLTSPEFCSGISFCNNTSACAATAPCAEPICDEGFCLARSLANACDETEWCNPEPGVGCQSLNGPHDNACGTICTMPGEPCRFGYVRCAASSVECAELGARPAGTSCGTDRICDGEGLCAMGVVDRPGVTISPTEGLVTTESGFEAQFAVSLTARPSASVIASFVSLDLSEGTLSTADLTFTPDDWNVAQQVTITGVDDALADDNITYTIQSLPLVSGDEDYAGIDPSDLLVTNLDNESPGVFVSPTAGLATTESGGSDSFTIVLQSQPTALVTISVASTDATEGTPSVASVTFTEANWNLPQSVGVQGMDDSIVDGAIGYTIELTVGASADPDYSGIDCDDVDATNVDDDLVGVAVSRTSGLVTSESGGSDTLDVWLTSEPTANVSIALGSSDLSEGVVSTPSLTFTSANWSTPQAVLITGVDDALLDGDVAFSIVTSGATSDDLLYDGWNPADIAVTNLDDDVPGVQVLPASGLTTTESGSVATFTLALNTAPTDDVIIALSSGDLTEGMVSPASVTFTPADWSTPQTVSVTGVDDVISDGDIAYNVVTAGTMSADGVYNNLVVADVGVTNVDDDPAAVNIVPNVGLVTTEGGGTASFSVVLGSLPAASVVVSFASGDATEGIVLPTSLTFTPTNWNVPRQVSVSGLYDGIADGDVAYTVVTGSAVSADPIYNGLAVVDVGVTNLDLIPFTQEGYVKASNTNASDAFGTALAVSADGNTMAIGAYAESSSATGIGGSESDNSAGSAGAVYVYVRLGGVWTQQAYVKASNTDAGDYFGYAVSLSADGNTLAVGAYPEDSNAVGINGDASNNSLAAAGAAYVFTRSGVTWSQQAYVKASNSSSTACFGFSVALSGDGSTLAVSGYYEDSNATGVDGNQLSASATNSGAVYVFTRSGVVWTQQAYVKASNTDAFDYFGFALALSSDGSTLAASTTFEASDATDVDGNQASNSAPNAGAVYVFARVAGVWSQQAYVKASNTETTDRFGSSVALSGDGDTLAIGAASEDSCATGTGGDQSDNVCGDSGAVYVLTRTGLVWTHRAYVKASNTGTSDGFGGGVSLSSDGNRLAVGAGNEASSGRGVGANQASNAAIGSGAVYLFNRVGMLWTQYAYMKASNAGGAFGYSIALSSDGSTVVAGAYAEDSNATGVDGDQLNTLAANSGAAYVFVEN